MAWRDYVQHNFWLKLLSLTFAVLIWFTVRFAIQHELGFNQRSLDLKPQHITVLKDSADSRLFRVIPEDAIVTVRGDATLLQRMSDRDFEVFVNLTQVTNPLAGHHRIEVLLPRGMTLVRVVPNAARVELVAGGSEPPGAEIKR